MGGADDDVLGRLQELVYEKSDLSFKGRKRALFERRVSERARIGGRPSLSAYYDALKADPAELDRLVNALTTNHTYFFRIPGHFDALREKVFPEIIEAGNSEAMRGWGKFKGEEAEELRRRAMRVRVWSPGCSTGEEVYSLAFTLLDVLKYPRAWDAQVLGTDIKREALAEARRGVYGPESLREADMKLMGPRMETVDGGWSVREEPRRLVSFRESNLKDISGPVPFRMTLTREDGASECLDARGYFDVIFCRNVMIYFDRRGQQKLVDALYGCLRPGGYLFTGDSEPLHLFTHGFERVGWGDAIYYRKPE